MLLPSIVQEVYYISQKQLQLESPEDSLCSEEFTVPAATDAKRKLLLIGGVVLVLYTVALVQTTFCVCR